MEKGFGQLLRAFRQIKQKRLKDLAADIGLDISYLSRIEVGARPVPKIHVRESIYSALQLNTMQIETMEKSLGQKQVNTIFRAPIGPGKVILMIMNTRDVSKLLRGSDSSLEKFVSTLDVEEVDM